MQITGIICSIDYAFKKNRSPSFECRIETGEKINLTYRGFLMIKQNDVISCSVKKEGNLFVVDLSTVNVKPVFSMDSIKEFISKCFISMPNVLKNEKKEKVSPQTFFECIRKTADTHKANILSEFISDCVKNLKNLCCKKHIVYSNAFRVWWNNNQIRRQLYCLGITKTMIYECRKHMFSSDVQLLQKIREDPISVVPLGFEVVESLCNRLGVPFKRKVREQFQFAFYIYSRYSKNGDVFCFIKDVQKKFQYEEEILSQKILKNSYDIVSDDEILMFSFVRRIQRKCASNIFQIVSSSKNESSVEISLTEAGKDASEEQKRIIEGCLSHKISCVEGPGGSGKTTFILANIVNSLLKTFGEQQSSFMLVSYTGKAVRVMKSVLRSQGIIADVYTMHKALTSRVVSLYRKTKEVLKQFKYLIVDEATMISTSLFNRFIETYGMDYRIIFIGDTSQIGSIDPGSMFECLLSSSLPGVFCGRLSEIFRTKDEDLLKTFNRIRLGKKIKESENFQVVSLEDLVVINDESGTLPLINEPTLKVIEKVVKEISNNFKDLTDCKILCPYVKQVEELNSFVIGKRKKLPVLFTDHLGRSWHISDSCTFLKNNYTFSVYNGDEGICCGIEDEYLKFDTENGRKSVLLREKRKDEEEMDDDSIIDRDSERETIFIQDISPSYALSIDKAQGSQYNTVVFYLPRMFSYLNLAFLNRRRIYTAFSRAKQKVIFIGNLNYLNSIICGKFPERNENLDLFFKKEFKKMTFASEKE